LKQLPEGAKLSIALDCWTSPFSQAFMAITGYFIDLNWDYREFLLGFEPLEGTHSGENLCSVLLKRLKDHNITHRILAITTDNASNNQTLMDRLNDEIETLAEVTGAPVVRVPCIAHVIQLSLKGLLVHMKLEPSNESAEREFKPRPTGGNKDILSTLNKVCSPLLFNTQNTYVSIRSGPLLSLSMLVLNAVTYF
jgi:hypothetical protein